MANPTLHRLHISHRRRLHRTLWSFWPRQRALALCFLLALSAQSTIGYLRNTRLEYRRETVQPLWNSIVASMPDVPTSHRPWPQVLLADAMLNGHIAPARLQQATQDLTSGVTNPLDRDYYTLQIATAQKATGDTDGAKQTLRAIREPEFAPAVLALTQESRHAALDALPTVDPRWAYQAYRGYNVDFTSSSPAPDEAPFYRPMRQKYAKIPKVPSSHSMTELARSGDATGARQAALMLDPHQNRTEEFLLHIAEIELQSGDPDTAMATVTLDTVDKEARDDELQHIALARLRAGDAAAGWHTLDAIPDGASRVMYRGDFLGSNEAHDALLKAIAMNQLRLGNGTAAVRTLDAITAAGPRQEYKCECLAEFLKAPYAASMRNPAPR